MVTLHIRVWLLSSGKEFLMSSWDWAWECGWEKVCQLLYGGELMGEKLLLRALDINEHIMQELKIGFAFMNCYTSLQPGIIGSSYVHIQGSSYLHISMFTDPQILVYLHLWIIGAWYLYIFGSLDPGISTSQILVSLHPQINLYIQPSRDPCICLGPWIFRS